jgi:hypothetical protein
MATQPQTPDDAPIGHAQITGRDKEWKILAEEAAQEQDPDKLLQIVNALNRAFEEEEARKKSA